MKEERSYHSGVLFKRVRCDLNEVDRKMKAFRVTFHCECGCDEFVESSEFYVACVKCGREYMNPMGDEE